MARIFVVGDTTLAEVKKQLDATLGAWKSPATPMPEKNFDVAIPKPQPRILLVDRPKSPPSVIMAGKVLDAKGAIVRASCRERVWQYVWCTEVAVSLKKNNYTIHATNKPMVIS